jgi:hypothetical protein
VVTSLNRVYLTSAITKAVAATAVLLSVADQPKNPLLEIFYASRFAVANTYTVASTYRPPDRGETYGSCNIWFIRPKTINKNGPASNALIPFGNIQLTLLGAIADNGLDKRDSGVNAIGVACTQTATRQYQDPGAGVLLLTKAIRTDKQVSDLVDKFKRFGNEMETVIQYTHKLQVEVDKAAVQKSGGAPLETNLDQVDRDFRVLIRYELKIGWDNDASKNEQFLLKYRILREQMEEEKNNIRPVSNPNSI